MRQYFRYGVQKAIMLSFHPSALRMRQATPALWVGALVVLGAAAVFVPAARLLLALLAALYVLVLLGAGGEHAVRVRRAGLAWALPLALCSIHIAWGVGFWIGWAGVARQAWARRAASGQ
jgi:hypothetical protein